MSIRNREMKVSQHLPKRLTVAEMFCGCGGFSHGFRNLGFDVVFGNDVKPAALRTFAANHQTPNCIPTTLQADIRTIPNKEILTTFLQHGIRPGDLDCLLGGPPCQGFSQMRRSKERSGDEIVKFRGYDKLDHDPRNDLVLRFLEVANLLQPKFIIIENVPQMLGHFYNGTAGGIAKAVVEVMGGMGYEVDVKKVNAADYGVPQLRERAVFFASRVCQPRIPHPTHGSSERPWQTVRDAIADLPEPSLTDEVLGNGSLNLYSAAASEYAAKLRNSKTFPFNHVTRRYSPRIIDVIKEMQCGETWDSASEKMRQKYDKLIQEAREPGERKDSVVRRLAKQGVLNPVFFKRYYWSAYTRLDWDRPALTITANANFLGSGRFTHPKSHRGITMREAARLQSFDDSFKFITNAEGEERTTDFGIGLDMIGEAVPPLLSEAFAKQIIENLAQPEDAVSWNRGAKVAALS